MTYGTIKVDTVTFTDAGVDKSVTLSGLVQNPTFSGNVTVTGTLSGVTVTGTTASFTSGVFAVGSGASPSIGKFLVGTSVPITGLYGSAYNLGATLNIATTRVELGGVFCSYRNDDVYNGISIARSKATTPGDHGLIGPNEYVSAVSFDGSDGTQFINAGQVVVGVEGTPAVGNMPTFMEFRTNPGGTVFSTTRMRIDSSGRLLVGTVSSPAYKLQLETDSAGKPSTNTWTIVSDERIKEEIELADLDLCYEAVKNIPLKRFKWKDEIYTEEQAYDRRKLGWIAQDVEAVFPKAVRQHEFKYNQVFEEVVIPAVPAELDDDGNIITEEQPERIKKGELISEEVIEDCRDLNSDQLYAAMYGAIQKLISKVELLEAEVQALKAT